MGQSFSDLGSNPVCIAISVGLSLVPVKWAMGIWGKERNPGLPSLCKMGRSVNS